MRATGVSELLEMHDVAATVDTERAAFFAGRCQCTEYVSAGDRAFEEFARLVEMARSEALALLVVLLGGEAGLRCGEMMALEWTDVDFAKRQLTVARSEWKGHVTMPKGGRIRYVPMTRRLTEALREARHLRGPRVLCDGTGKPLTQKVIQVLVRRTARRANVKPGIHILRHYVLFSSGDAWGASKSHSGTGRTPGPGHDATLHALEPRGDRCGDSAVGDEHRDEPHRRGEIVEAAGTEGPKAHIH